ncbi:MAG TPA: hypothetical protein VKE25_04675 [Actinomycetes bacterium]|nr:hypothetical protein [Actinomycetes bacterium]
MNTGADTIRAGRAQILAARRDRNAWCARGAVAGMRAGLARLGVSTVYLADTPLLRLNESGELLDLACVPDRHDNDALWWAWLHPGSHAGAPPELEFICRADDPDAAHLVAQGLFARTPRR